MPQRHLIVKTGGDDWVELRVPTLDDPAIDYIDLLNRVRYTRGRVRAHVERAEWETVLLRSTCKPCCRYIEAEHEEFAMDVRRCDSSKAHAHCK